MTMGIYKIEQLSTNKKYIGSSKNIESRWKEHVRDLRKNEHHSWKLQKAWNKYGEDNFKFEIIEIVKNKKDLLTIEQNYINKYNSTKNGSFNISPSTNISLREFIQGNKEYSNFIEYKNKKLGDFIFYFYDTMEYLKNNFNDADLVKIFYLSTFLKKNNVLMLDNNITFINKKMIQRLLNIQNKAFYKFYNNLINKNILIERNNHIYMNIICFYKGSKKHYANIAKKKLKDCTQIFIDFNRKLYKSVNSKSLSNISILYKLIPYTNLYNSLICTNPKEIDLNQINEINLSRLSKEINRDKSQISRLIKTIQSHKIEGNLLLKVVTENNKNKIFINPKLFYIGKNKTTLNNLLNLFSKGE